LRPHSPLSTTISACSYKRASTSIAAEVCEPLSMSNSAPSYLC
jgi:hypothetical protein